MTAGKFRAERYWDGGRFLLADIETGKENCVVVYKVDRLSRSLLDFTKIVETFDRHGVSFVSVTQAFNTATSMGRLVLNVLLSFAQFEREMISERTRDKIAAARRKGKWSGGMPILGYTVVDTKSVLDSAKAARVRQIFAMYLKHESLLEVVRELDSRGWRTKQWETRKAVNRGGRRFDKSSLYQLLTNVVYIGKVRYKDEIHDGEQQPIVDGEVFARAQTLLKRNGRCGGRAVRNKHGALLRGLLTCDACECGMSHSYTTNGARQYRYYVCNHAQKPGWQTCPSPSIPAGEIERLVLDQIRCIGHDPTVVLSTWDQVQRQTAEKMEQQTAEKIALRQQLRADHTELARLSASGGNVAQLAELHDRIRVAEQRSVEIERDLNQLKGESLDEAEVRAALANFDALWDTLTPREQARIVELLVERVTYHSQRGTISITFRPCGIKSLGEELAEKQETAA